ncbi:MAG: hypothetical protein ACE5D0_08710 [Fidelibacterota bacterium]
MRSLILIFTTSIVCGGTAYTGMQNWYHPHRMALAGSGGAFSSVTSDVINPAALWTLKKQFDVSFLSYPANISAQSFHLVLPGEASVTAYGLRHMNYGLFEGRDQNNLETDLYSASDTWFDYSASGHSSRWPISWGVSAGLFFSSIEKKQSVVVMFSSGILFHFSKLDSKIGLSLLNMGSVIKTYSGNEELLPVAFVTSFSKKLAHLPLELGLDLVKEFDMNDMSVRLGGVFTLPYDWQLKLGTTSNRIDQAIYKNVSKNLLTDVGIGLVWIYDNYSFESSIYSYGPGGWITGFAIGIQF